MKTIFLSLTILLTALCGDAQIITTICGTGVSGSSGNGGPATAARINRPYGMVFDSIGNLYFTDEMNHTIRKIDTFGIITLIAGTGSIGFTGDGGPATSAKLAYPRGIDIDKDGNIIFVDRLYNRIRKINAGGIISTVAGNGVVGCPPVSGPATGTSIYQEQTVVTDEDGNFYFSGGCPGIHIVNTDGNVSEYLPSLGFSTAGNIRIKKDKQNNTYVTGGSIVYKIDNTGAMTIIAGQVPLYGYAGDGGAATSALLDGTMDAEPDEIGNIYISDVNNRRIRKVSADGIISTFAGDGIGLWFDGDNIPAAHAVTQSVTAIRYHKGALYLVENGFRRIRKIVNQPPRFINGHRVVLRNCTSGPFNIDSALAVFDADSVQGLRWYLQTPPLHGFINLPYTTTANADTIYTSGITYTPPASFSGIDSFRTIISDDWFTDTAWFIINTFPPHPPLTLSGTTTICTGHPVSLSASVPGGTWTSSTSSIATVSSGTVYPVTAGATSIKYAISNVCSTDSATLSVNVVLAAMSSLFITSSADSVCAGTPMTLTTHPSNPGAAPVYRWYKNGVLTSVTSDLWSSSAFNNGDVIYCTMHSSQQCTFPDSVISNSKTLRIFNAIFPSLALTDTPSVICEASLATVIPLPTLGGTTPHYSWNVNGTPAGVLSPLNYIAHNGDVVTCTMQSSDTTVCVVANTVTANIHIYTHPTVTPAIHITVSGNDSVDYLYEHIFFAADATYGGSEPAFQWYENGIPVPGATSNYFDAWLTSNDTVFCKMISSLDCIAPATVFSDTVIMKGDYLGLNTIMQSKTTLVYPNPNNGNFSINISEHFPTSATLQIFNMVGNLVYEQPVTTGQPIAISTNLNPGFYTGKIVSGVNTTNFNMIVTNQ